jgi:hypothetical protein
VAEPADLEKAKAAAVPAEAHPRAREFAGEGMIVWVLRAGSWCGGGLFLLSLALELLPAHSTVGVLISHLRVAGASVLLVTPIVRLAVGGLTLGLNGEWRYVLYALGVLTLMAIAIGAGVAA